jgi:hypothetical protein
MDARRSHSWCASANLVLRDVRDGGACDGHEVGGRDAHGLVVRAGLDHDRGPLGDLWIDDDGIGPAAHRRHSAELELRVVAAQIVLCGQVNFVSTATVGLAHLPEVDSRRRRQHGPQVSLRELDDEGRLRLADEARPGFGGRRA